MAVGRGVAVGISAMDALALASTVASTPGAGRGIGEGNAVGVGGGGVGGGGPEHDRLVKTRRMPSTMAMRIQEPPRVEGWWHLRQ